MLRGAYRLLLLLAYPWVRARLRWRARREPAYAERVPERFGYPPASLPSGSIWFHTVSAGETIAAVPIIETLAAEFPELPFLVTTMTPTGSAQVRARLGGQVAHCYAPYDFPRAVERFYAAAQPRMLLLMETELWPNLIAEAHRRGVPVLLINARLSERSARGYARIGSLTRDMLRQLTFIACQYPDHARRFLDLGAAPAQVSALGSIKFDVQLPADYKAEVKRLASLWGLGRRPVWIAGSTHAGEEAIVLSAHQRVLAHYPDACLLLVPRHPHRASEVASQVASSGLSVVLQSELDGAPLASCNVLIDDSMGRLQYLYGLAQVAFVGGSLVPLGGHNPIEPALCGQPLLMGPHGFNFSDVVAAFSDAGCLRIVADAEELAAQLTRWFANPAARAAEGAAARQVVADNAGASTRLLELLRAQIRSR